MKKWAILLSIVAFSAVAEASWYWPFSGGEGSRKAPRVSELMEPASLKIDEASDLAADGKTSEAVEKYREALVELDRIESENPDRIDSPEFNTLKNKRAYVKAAIDSLHLAEAQDNAKPVAVTDTTELQKRYDARQAAKRQKAGATNETAKVEAKAEKASEPAKRAERKGPLTKREKLAMAAGDLAKGDYAAVELVAKELLDETPNDAAALNLKAAAETAKGDWKSAESTLDQAINSHPRSHYAYYNMARLYLQARGDRSGAKRYYQLGRDMGGPADAKLEDLLK